MGRRKKPQNVQMVGANKTEIVNNTEALSIVPGEQTEKEESREERFVKNLFLGMSVTEAASAAGYSASYSGAAVYSKFNSPRFQNKIKEVAKSCNIKFLPKIMSIHDRALRKMSKDLDEGNIESVSKLRHISRDTLRMTGLLVDDAAPSAVSYVNIQSLQMLITDKMNRNGSGEDTKD